MTLEQQQWLTTTAAEAAKSSHIFPQMAACEAGLESAFGQSTLAKEALNLFGTKAHGHPTLGVVNIPTKEFLDGQWTVVDAAWMKYDTLAACFEDRMATLRRLSAVYPHYSAALAATDSYIYVTEVSKTWSTDPSRAAKVIQIYGEYFREAPNNAEDVQDIAND